MKTIKLTQGKVALVDDADYEAVSAHKWFAMKDGRGLFYAARGVRNRNGKKALQFLHRFLLPDVHRVDHRDGNGLDCRQENMRPATSRQNAQGFRRKTLTATSKYRGVSRDRKRQKWQAQIKLDGRVIFLGRFESETDAAIAYNVAALHYFGEFAQLNNV